MDWGVAICKFDSMWYHHQTWLVLSFLCLVLDMENETGNNLSVPSDNQLLLEFGNERE
jgi:hypothetical protein